MSLFKDLRTTILEENFKMVYLNQKLDIINYFDILHFDTNKIIISSGEGIINVIGKNLVISKLLKDELLIEGLITNIIIGDKSEK